MSRVNISRFVRILLKFNDYGSLSKTEELSPLKSFSLLFLKPSCQGSVSIGKSSILSARVRVA